MAVPFLLSDRASDVRPGCKTQRIAPTPRQVADMMCARIKEREYFKTCIVGHVKCCLQCGPTLRHVMHPHDERRLADRPLVPERIRHRFLHLPVDSSH
ncbi:hypothetical protein PoB_004025600 [Plakobranchus ocellatus]|uniref:Uncharacterized protein n=1 Tax=Plakobranchus ocellatus TaxID=259542 RepID=A0AAV4ARJ2_9GAST|nr:hypothetical protein PoB_004025600 [Plakobranchus ocellatus]